MVAKRRGWSVRARTKVAKRRAATFPIGHCVMLSWKDWALNGAPKGKVPGTRTKIHPTSKSAGNMELRLNDRPTLLPTSIAESATDTVVSISPDER